jgi:hypothetical protein
MCAFVGFAVYTLCLTTSFDCCEEVIEAKFIAENGGLLWRLEADDGDCVLVFCFVLRPFGNVFLVPHTFPVLEAGVLFVSFND